LNKDRSNVVRGGIADRCCHIIRTFNNQSSTYILIQNVSEFCYDLPKL